MSGNIWPGPSADEKIHFHYLLGNNFLKLTNVVSMEKLYNALKPAKFFACFHEQSTSDDCFTTTPHIHIVHSISHRTKSQRNGQLVAKIRSKLSNLDPSFSLLLRQIATPVPSAPADQNMFIDSLVANRPMAKHNAFAFDAPSFSKSVRYRLKSHAQATWVSCLQFIPKTVFICAGVVDARDDDDTMSALEDADSFDDDPMDGLEPDVEKETLDRDTEEKQVVNNSDPTPVVACQTLLDPKMNRSQKYDCIASLITETQVQNRYELETHIPTDRQT